MEALCIPKGLYGPRDKRLTLPDTLWECDIIHMTSKGGSYITNAEYFS